MGAVSGLGHTYNLPNFVGELFKVTPADTPFLAMAGGLSGGRAVTSKQFTWQTVDNTATGQITGIVEGADPGYEERSRSEISNVVQIFSYGIEVSYTKQAATGQLGPSATSILGTQPVSDEISFQAMLKLERAARDVDWHFLNGTYQLPADNTTGRQMRGILPAVTTVNVAAGAATLTKAMIDSCLKQMADAGAPFRQPVMFLGSHNKQVVSSIYGYAPESRNVGGVNIETIETDFCRLGIVYERHIPADDVLIADMSVVRPAFLSIPGKGHFFMEPKPATGSSDKYMLYGEIGLEYGPELWHGKITNTATS